MTVTFDQGDPTPDGVHQIVEFTAPNCDLGDGIINFLDFEYFAATIGVNNDYGPAQSYICPPDGLTEAAADTTGNYCSWEATGIRFELDKKDGQGYVECTPVSLGNSGNAFGFGNSGLVHCGEDAIPVPSDP